MKIRSTVAAATIVSLSLVGATSAYAFNGTVVGSAASPEPVKTVVVELPAAPIATPVEVVAATAVEASADAIATTSTVDAAVVDVISPDVVSAQPAVAAPTSHESYETDGPETYEADHDESSDYDESSDHGESGADLD